MKIFETHAHLDDAQFNKDRDAVISKCFKSGIERIINVGCNTRSSEFSIKLAKKYPQIYASVGYHPHDAAHADIKAIAQLAKQDKVMAIGEIGLDYYRNISPPDVQKDVFSEQIKLAMQLDMPMIIHDREAHTDCYDILKKNKAKKVVFHCFSGDTAFAKQVLAEGWIISFTGTITYKNSQMGDVIRLIPKDQFFVETDCPYLAPHPHRGKRNAPYLLSHVIEKIAEIKGLPPKLIASTCYDNASKFFGI